MRKTLLIAMAVGVAAGPMRAQDFTCEDLLTPDHAGVPAARWAERATAEFCPGTAEDPALRQEFGFELLALCQMRLDRPLASAFADVLGAYGGACIEKKRDPKAAPSWGRRPRGRDALLSR